MSCVIIRVSFVLAAFGYFLGHQLILFVGLMAVCEGLNLTIQLGYFVFEVESDSATVISSFVRWDFVYLFDRVLTSSFDPLDLLSMFIGKLLQLQILWLIGLIFIKNFSGLLDYRDLPAGLTSIFHLNTHETSHVRQWFFSFGLFCLCFITIFPLLCMADFGSFYTLFVHFFINYITNRDLT